MDRKIRIKVGDLKRILREEFLREAGGNDPTAGKEPEREDGEDSVDAQIDRYLGEYESEAKSAKTEGKDWRRAVRRIVEAGDDEGDNEGGDDEFGLGDEGSDAPSKPGVDSIDMDSYANSVMRLIDNAASLLELRNTLLRRAANFLGKNYAPEVVEAFKENLRSEHGIEIGKSPEEAADDEFPAPAAARAGGGAGGAPA
jgi:hypothetical protein